LPAAERFGGGAGGGGGETGGGGPGGGGPDGGGEGGGGSDGGGGRGAGGGGAGGEPTVQRHSAGVASALPRSSLARTRKTCAPGSTVITTGDRHDAYACSSSAHSKVAPGALAENVKDAVRSVESGGPASISVSGGSVSTVHTIASGLVSTLPA
jgi:hypothetical protein